MKTIKPKYIGKLEDFTEDTTFTELGLKRTSPSKESELNEAIDNIISFLETNLSHFILDDKRRIKGHIQNLKGLKNMRILKGKEEVFDQEKESINKFFKKSQERYQSDVDKASNIRKEMEQIRESSNNMYKGATERDEIILASNKKRLKELADLYNKIPVDIRLEASKRDKNTTFSSLGLKKKGQGWHGESERHSEARKKKDFIEDSMGYEDWKAGKEGKWITVKGAHIYLTQGKTPKELILEKVSKIKEEQKKEEVSEPKEETKEEIKKPKRTTLSPEEKRRRETEAQARSTPKSKEKEHSQKEKLIQKIIEQQGYDRERAEHIVNEQDKEKEKKKQELMAKMKEFGNVIKSAQAKKVDKKTHDRLLQKYNEIKTEINQLYGKIDMKKGKFDYIGSIKEMHQLHKLRKDLTHDFIQMNEFDNITQDMNNDFQIFSGPITRAGAFSYSKGILHKNWDNIKEVFSDTAYIPLKVSETKNSHSSGLVKGYATNWSFNEKDQQVFGDIVIFNDLNMKNIVEEKFPISIGFKDEIIHNDILNIDEQIIQWIDHLALSAIENPILRDQDRCSTLGGKSCYAKIKKPTNETLKEDFLYHCSICGQDKYKKD